MRKEQIELIENIQNIQQNQGLLLEKPKTSQQKFLHLYGQRYMILREMFHKNIDQVLTYLPSTFANLALKIAYMCLCLQNRIEVSLDNYPILRMLTNWADTFPTIVAQKQFNIIDTVMQKQQIQILSAFEEYITYIDLIGADLMKMLNRQLKNENITKANSRNAVDNLAVSYFDAQDLLKFVNLSLPKILFNILLPNEMIPTQYQKQFLTFECLYKNSSLQYFIRTRQSYAMVIKTLIEIMLTMDLKPSQEKILMDIVFRYFYAFHHDKKYNATDIFMRTYNKLSESVRFALTDEFILFLRISRKIGKSKFIDFLIQKSQWFKQITQFINEKPIGYKKDMLTPFNSLNLSEDIIIETGKTEMRYFQVLEDYSLFYFRMEMMSLDITIKLWYFGEIDCPKNTKIMLAQKVKVSGLFANNLMAAKRGIYAFEFDNSYSWMKSKTVKYQIIVLSPIEVQSIVKYPWINAYYNNIVMNQMGNKDKIWTIKKAPLNKDQKQKETVNIIRNGEYYCMKMVKNNKLLEYETENENRLLQKINIISEDSVIQWMIDGQLIQDLRTVQEYILKNKQAKQVKILENNSQVKKKQNHFQEKQLTLKSG